MSGSENQSRLKTWLLDKKQQYLTGWDREPTVILLGSAILLTLYRFYSSRAFFRKHLAKYAARLPLAGLHLHYYWFLSSLITLLLLPMLVVKFGAKGRLRDYGCRLSNGKLGWGFAIGGWLIMIPVLLLVVHLFPAFQAKYPLNKLAAASWKTLLLYELAYGAYLFAWEFFFRGFMLFGVEKRFGNYSILIQTIPFAVMHYSKPFPEAAGSIVAGLLLGAVAFETRSFVYGAAIHWLVAASMDIIAVMSR